MHDKIIGLYLVDNKYYLYFERDEDCGFVYKCFDIDKDEWITEGVVSWEDIEHHPARGIEAPVRLLAIKDIGLEGTRISRVENKDEVLNKLGFT